MKNKIELLYNPFTKIAGWKAFGVGIIIVTISVVIAGYGEQYFQGAFNVKLMAEVNFKFAILSQVIGLLSMALCFYIAGLVFSKGVRFQDVLGTTTLARYPYIIPAFFGYFMDFEKMKNLTPALLSGDIASVKTKLVYLTIIFIVMIVVLVWYIALLWNAFRISTDLKGGKHRYIYSHSNTKRGVILCNCCL